MQSAYEYTCVHSKYMQIMYIVFWAKWLKGFNWLNWLKTRIHRYTLIVSYAIIAPPLFANLEIWQTAFLTMLLGP